MLKKATRGLVRDSSSCLYHLENLKHPAEVCAATLPAGCHQQREVALDVHLHSLLAVIAVISVMKSQHIFAHLQFADAVDVQTASPSVTDSYLCPCFAARCSGHSATVRTIDWSTDGSVLQSNCAAREILYWNARTGKQMPGSCRDTKWSGWTCLYGFPVMGIWPDTADGSDINACDRLVVDCQGMCPANGQVSKGWRH